MVGAAAGAAIVVAGLTVAPGTASAALPGECVQPDPTGVVTCTYTAAGQHTLTLPAGVESVQVTAIGGHGGAITNAQTGGRGAVVTGTVAVPANSHTLVAMVASNGASTKPDAVGDGGEGGEGGGGHGGTTPRSGASPGAGGGGASDIRTSTNDLASRVLIAAGGGGAANYGVGGNAGEPAGKGYLSVAAQAGTSTAGGAGGTFLDFAIYSGAAGSLGLGGAGGPVEPDPFNQYGGGGGGGGGLYGGGGGAIGSGGAGGSSLAPDGGAVALTDQAPSITITYQPPATPNPPNPPCSGSLCLPSGVFGSS
ncbi:glycine-rich protein [Gordonia soli]|uniref:receptor protein-tyrosine kinase n=1 Tax=Gordonia soli NBRC 108243 TaxID=1223545 RepID=M0QMQ6_9ACTN|nr:glycine-rich protein [Gordonia soli]GAC69576.1 hypothetical protein GS4_26_00230 [Gordonia soli NBRC 108243]